MASKYARRMAVPSDFAEILKGFTREVLRSLPSDLEGPDAEQWMYEFGANYFARRADDAPAPAFLELDNLSAEELEAKLIDLFIEADVDASGSLDRREFKTVRYSVVCGAEVCLRSLTMPALWAVLLPTGIPEVCRRVGLPSEQHSCDHGRGR